MSKGFSAKVLYVSKDTELTKNIVIPKGAVGNTDAFIADIKYKEQYTNNYNIISVGKMK